MERATCSGVIASDVSGYVYCLDAAGGSPISWDASSEFDLGDLEFADLGGAFAAGFVIVATAYVIGLGARTVLAAVRSL